jgi:hypothetical protein
MKRSETRTKRSTLLRLMIGGVVRKMLFILVCVLALVGLGGGFENAQAQFLIDHFKVYNVNPPVPVTLPPVILKDQWSEATVNLTSIELFATPVSKNGEPIIDPKAHQNWYRIAPITTLGRSVYVDNQFGRNAWTVYSPRYLVVPANKNDQGNPNEPNHFKCYDATGPALNRSVTLEDQFGTEPVTVLTPALFCNPVSKNGEPILHPDDHLACYTILPNTKNINLNSKDQFNLTPGYSLHLDANKYLCVPSTKWPDGSVPALSTKGAILFLLLTMGALFVVHRRRSGRMIG